jgi:hypothetical protein
MKEDVQDILLEAIYGSHLAQQVMYLRNLEIILFCQQQQQAA